MVDNSSVALALPNPGAEHEHRLGGLTVVVWCSTPCLATAGENWELGKQPWILIPGGQRVGQAEPAHSNVHVGVCGKRHSINEGQLVPSTSSLKAQKSRRPGLT